MVLSDAVISRIPFTFKGRYSLPLAGGRPRAPRAKSLALSGRPRTCAIMSPGIVSGLTSRVLLIRSSHQSRLGLSQEDSTPPPNPIPTLVTAPAIPMVGAPAAPAAVEGGMNGSGCGTAAVLARAAAPAVWGTTMFPVSSGVRPFSRALTASPFARIASSDSPGNCFRRDAMNFSSAADRVFLFRTMYRALSRSDSNANVAFLYRGAARANAAGRVYAAPVAAAAVGMGAVAPIVPTGGVAAPAAGGGGAAPVGVVGVGLLG